MTTFEYLIAVDELKAHLDEPGLRIIDCRHDLMRPDKGYREYRQDHIPGAQFASLDDDLADPVTESSGRHPLPSPDSFASTLSGWGIGNDTQVVAYDHASAAVAARLWWMLKWVGHRPVAVLDGGYAAWRAAGLPVSDVDVRPTAGQFVPAPDFQMLVSTSELLALFESGEAPPLVDARDADRFSGVCEPIDSAAGHVPGARNYPFSDAIDGDGRMLQPNVLREDWGRVLGSDLRQPWIAMCGSGVTACHLALSAGLAGYRRPRIYVGSWSEWILDPRRPVATGEQQTGCNAADLT
jgi:thiosulfate/3-mercaptopyruvate sulfurtransferase